MYGYHIYSIYLNILYYVELNIILILGHSCEILEGHAKPSLVLLCVCFVVPHVLNHSLSLTRSSATSSSFTKGAPGSAIYHLFTRATVSGGACHVQEVQFLAIGREAGQNKGQSYERFNTAGAIVWVQRLGEMGSKVSFGMMAFGTCQHFTTCYMLHGWSDDTGI